MTTISNVSGTAFVVAEYRAEENSAEAPLYRDGVVGFFLSEESREAADRIAGSYPAVKDLVKIRTKYLDDMLDQQIDAGVRQVVILGAGLDTRAVRKPAPGVTYFEIDDVSTLELKLAAYRQHGITAAVRFIPGNYVTDGLVSVLGRNGFDFSLPTYFIWEGNTMYLPLESTKEILRQIAAHVRHFRVSFDYMAEAVISKTTGDAGTTALVESFARMGAPWLSGIRDIQALARELHLRVVENFKTSALIQKYGRAESLRAPIHNFYSLCTIGL